MLGPLGLHTRDYGAFAKTGAKTVGAVFPVGLRPHGLPASVNRELNEALISAAAPAEAGNLTVQVSQDVRALGPHGFVTPERAFGNKGTGEQTLTLTGAVARAQGEELEGTNVTIRLDGVALHALSNDIPGFGEDPGGRFSGLDLVEIDGKFVDVSTIDSLDSFRKDAPKQKPKKVQKRTRLKIERPAKEAVREPLDTSALEREIEKANIRLAKSQELKIALQIARGNDIIRKKKDDEDAIAVFMLDGLDI